MDRRRDSNKLAAIAAGLKKYVPSRPCLKGHYLRYISGLCVSCNIKSVSSYKKKNNIKNTKEYMKYWYSKNPDKRAIYEKNRTEERKIIRSKRGRFTICRATPKWLDINQKNEILSFYLKARALSNSSGEKYEVDHIVPLKGKTVSGLHVPWNLQVITAEKNRRKQNKLEI